MKLTLLEYVQDILNDMGSDQVDSILDTFESEQVAQIVKSTYLSMMSNRNWPHLKRSVELELYSGYNPTTLVVPEYVKEIVLINYNVRRVGSTRDFVQEMKWLENDEFLRRGNSLDSNSPNVEVLNDDMSGMRYYIRNDTPPKYYTSFDDKHIIFDAYEKGFAENLIPGIAQVLAYIMPIWIHEDDAIPDLPEEAVVALLEEAKSRAMFRIKQMVDTKAEQESQKQQRWLSRKAWSVHGGIQYPNYGRRGRNGRCSNPYFSKND